MNKNNERHQFNAKKFLIFSMLESKSSVVLSTLREAADKDYTITVFSVCCIDLDEEVHRILLNNIFPRQQK